MCEYELPPMNLHLIQRKLWDGPSRLAQNMIWAGAHLTYNHIRVKMKNRSDPYCDCFCFSSFGYAVDQKKNALDMRDSASVQQCQLEPINTEEEAAGAKNLSSNFATFQFLFQFNQNKLQSLLFFFPMFHTLQFSLSSSAFNSSVKVKKMKRARPHYFQILCSSENSSFIDEDDADNGGSDTNPFAFLVA